MSRNDLNFVYVEVRFLSHGFMSIDAIFLNTIVQFFCILYIFVAESEGCLLTELVCVPFFISKHNMDASRRMHMGF